MKRIAIFGKGGIGKSTIASNVSYLLAASGKKVLHVGCDPKMDSTLSLMRTHIRSFNSNSEGPSGGAGLLKSVHASPFKNVYCLEGGGPQPGVGCAGAGIGAMLDAMSETSLLEKEGFDATVFDVLGDVVCGGFAAPLRRGFAEKIVIVTSEEHLSLYAANRLIMMTETYARNGVYLAGLAANLRTPAGLARVEEFARTVNTRVLGVMFRDPAVAEAEKRRLPAAAASPGCDFTARARSLCSAILKAGRPAEPPRAMSEPEFFDFAEGRSAPPPPRPLKSPRRPAAGPADAAAMFSAAGFSPSGLEGDQIICDWGLPSGAVKVVFAPLTAAAEGRVRISDWTVCLHPSQTAALPAGLGKQLAQAAGALAGLRYEKMLSVFSGVKDFYKSLVLPAMPGDPGRPLPGSPSRSHIGFGQWQRFIFPDGPARTDIPPGAAIVEHGDQECRFCSCESDTFGPFSINTGLKGFGRKRLGPVLPHCDARVRNTGFDSKDAVFGGESKALEHLYAAARATGRGGLVEFYVCCSPMLLAEDTSAMARKVERDTGARVIALSFNGFELDLPQKAAARAEFIAKKLSANTRKPVYDVYLAGWGELAGDKTAHLAGLLAARGITSAPPGTELYSGSAGARLQVLPEPDSSLCAAYTRAGYKWLVPPAPYGFYGTRAWLAAVAAALGRKNAASGPSREQSARAAELRKKAGRFTAAFVLAPEELPLLAAASELKKVPVLPVTAEGGFRIRLFLYGAAPAKALAALKAAMPGIKLSVSVFRTQAELDALLRKERRMGVVYSDVRRDPRVTRSGKSPFSAELFEPGYDGALVTWSRLIDLCEWDFNERYFVR